MTSGVTLELAGATEAIYGVLGRRVGELRDDGYVVGLFEMARACGAASLALREAAGVATVTPAPVVADVLTRSIDADPSGALCVYATTMVVVPRLLVALRDARVARDDESLAPTLVQVTDTLVGALRRLAEHAHDQEVYDDPEWQAAARALARTLDDAGYGESLVISR